MPLPIRREAARSRVVCASAPDELRVAMAQARAWALESPALRIGVVFDDLRERRAEIRAAADDILCPEIAAQANPDRPRPYNLSLGERLVDVPLVEHGDRAAGVAGRAATRRGGGRLAACPPSSRRPGGVVAARGPGAALARAR